MTTKLGGKRLGAGRNQTAPSKLMRVPQDIEPYIKRYISTLKTLFMDQTTFNTEGLEMSLNPEQQIIDVSPDLAKKWKSKSIRNRPLNLRKVKEIQNDIESNLWKFDGTPLRFNKSGLLMDGQHRLEAIILANKTVLSSVVTNIDDEAIKTIDSGKSKTGTDMAVMLGYTRDEARTADTALKWVCRYLKGGFRQVHISNGYIYDELENNESLIQSTKYVLELPTTNRPIKAGILAFIHYLTKEKNKQKSDEFIARLVLGDKLDLDSPIYQLRLILSKQDYNSYKLDILEKVATTINAWNAYKNNQKVDKYGTIIWRRKGKKEFPQIT